MSDCRCHFCEEYPDDHPAVVELYVAARLEIAARADPACPVCGGIGITHHNGEARACYCWFKPEPYDPATF